MRTSPCNKCPKSGCGAEHDTCKDYLKFQAGCEQDRKERFEEAIANMNTKNVARYTKYY